MKSSASWRCLELSLRTRTLWKRGCAEDMRTEEQIASETLVKGATFICNIAIGTCFIGFKFSIQAGTVSYKRQSRLETSKTINGL